MDKISNKLDCYDDFSCIADKCSITCCQEWKIAVDEETYQKWKHLQKENNDSITELVEENDGSKVMKLTENHICSQLNEQKLCELVRKYGEDCISETCQTFPRVIHEFDLHTEYSLTSCCPEVVDLLAKKEKVTLQGVDSIKECNQILFVIRDFLVELIQDNKIPVEQGLMIGFYCLLEMFEEKELSVSSVEKYGGEETIIQLAQVIENMEFSPLDTFDENNELLLDISENYRKQNLYSSFLEPVTRKAEEFTEGYEEEEIKSKLELFEKEYAQYDILFRNYLAVELYNTLLIPSGDLESLVVMLQWIGLEYAVIRHALFIQWILNDCNLDYEDVRNYIVVISRMTGYDQEDIYEYLENSFQELFWEWGYFALVVGNKGR